MKNILDVIAEYQLRLNRRENGAQTRIISAYESAQKEIEKELDKLIRKIETAQAKGEVFSPSWLFRRDRLQVLLNKIETKLAVFAKEADAITQNAQASAVQYGAGSVNAVFDASDLVQTFSRLNERELEQFIGITEAGSPVRELFDALGKDLSRNVREVFQQGIVQGWNPNKIASKVKDSFGGNLNRARTIARTEILRASRESARASMLANRDVVQEWQWLCTRSARTCAACWAMDGKRFSITEPLGSHPRCLLAGQMVSSTTPQAVTKRWFDGQVVEITTSNGSVLSVTENHPILTANGWVAAGQLREGMNVVGTRFSERVVAFINPDDYNIPTPVEQVFETVSRKAGMMSRCMPSAAENFHGDGEGGEVNVILPDSELRRKNQVTFNQPFTQLNLINRDLGLMLLFPFGNALQLGFADFASASGFISSHDISRMFFGCTLAHHKLISLFLTANSNRGLFLQNALDNTTRNAIILCNFILRFAHHIMGSDITFANIVNVPVDNRLSFNLQDAVNYLVRYSELPSEFSSAFAPLIEFNEIRKIRRFVYRGHVYNLQTKEKWYIANGIITHNCRCTMLPVVDGLQYPKPAQKEFSKLLSAQEQQDVLGNKRFDLWKSKRVGFDDFVKTSYHPRYGVNRTVKPLKELSP